MTSLDLLYLGLIAVWGLVEHFLIWPTFVQRSQADAPRARTWLWSTWTTNLWGVAAAGVALWLFEARGWQLLRFSAPQGWRLWSAIGLVLVYVAVSVRTAVKLARTRLTKRVRISNANVAMLAPQTMSELVLWAALSLSAGFGEEFVFRGYLMWVFRPLVGLWGAAAISLAAFALAHSYQGAKGVVGVAITGGVFTLVVLIFGSLWPAIALHAAIDICHGVIAWVALRELPGRAASVPAPA